MILLKNKKIKYLLLSSLAIVIIGITFAAFVIKNYKSSAISKTATIYLPTGSTFEQQMDSIRLNGNIKNFDRFTKYLKIRNVTNIKPGRYILTKGLSYHNLIMKLRSGQQDAINVIFNNIRSKEKLAAVISDYLEADSASLVNTLNDSIVAASYGFNHNNFIGMFIPNTYQIYWNTDATGFIDRMYKEYRKFWNDKRMELLEKHNLTPQQAITLASIVAEETAKTDEMPRVAGVYHNRLRIGMPLQADPTVKFAVGDFSLRRILTVHTQTDSPYNTYKYSGLPPGPISVPPVTAIDAVLNPEEHNYIYFCAREDFSGYHNFAVNHTQHLRNREKYIKALNERGIR